MYPYADGLWAPRNQWYVAGWSNEITRQPLERWLLDEPVVFYRTEAGQIVAMHGRCPHRQFPLAKGNVVGDRLECSYHGFTFDKTGACVRIPTQTKVPSSCRIASYPVVERWQWFWIWMGDPALADESLIPDHDTVKLTAPGWHAVPAATHLLKARHQLMHENLCDLSHLTFLHPGIIGVDDVAATEFEVQGARDWFRDERTMLNQEPTGFFSDILGYHKPIDRLMSMEFFLPCLHLAAEIFLAHDKKEGEPGRELGAYKVHHAVTPSRAHETHYFVAYSRNFAVDDQRVTDIINAAFAAVLQQDVDAVEALEAMLQRSGERQFKDFLARGDATSVQVRRAMEALIRSEQKGAASAAA
ncbi:aromatic ring-hydroxylating dioxygenase subunit alpha [Solimonas marina]|uniref:Aromatic ring-hydroxylating dioxygenase subunit alpha n=1 Tax=Solimonas marina TaxID=2714601 RepID=A0A970B9C0_9GAMM|nr:aromatic ring-hydroxylating dioxygenase subunit alpha [Solimonas marina]NKF22251.1 aromatic ring-hydroxylating dioxygenase subunit alpha [Solimonas marina]